MIEEDLGDTPDNEPEPMPETGVAAPSGPQVLKPHLVLSHGQPATTTLAIAEHFGKLHKDVLKAIKNLDCSEEFRQRNFAPTVYSRPNPSGGQEISAPMYTITRDGFAFLVMGFTGAKVAAWHLTRIK